MTGVIIRVAAAMLCLSALLWVEPAGAAETNGIVV